MSSLRDELIKDAANMEEIAIRMGDRADIWQDRFIYAMAVSILHILTWIIRKEDKNE